MTYYISNYTVCKEWVNASQYRLWRVAPSGTFLDFNLLLLLQEYTGVI